MKVTADIPVAVWRSVQSGASRRGITPESFLAQLIEGRIEPTLVAKRQLARRKEVARMLELNFSAAEIAARIGCSYDTAKEDVRYVLAHRRDAA